MPCDTSSRSAVDGVLSIGARSIKGSINSSVRASYFFGRYFVRTNTSAAMKSGKVMPMTGTSVTKKITTASANCSRVKRAMTGNSNEYHARSDLRSRGSDTSKHTRSQSSLPGSDSRAMKMKRPCKAAFGIVPMSPKA